MSPISRFTGEPNIKIYRRAQYQNLPLSPISRFIGEPNIMIYQWPRYLDLLVSPISRFIGGPDIKIYRWVRLQNFSVSTISRFISELDINIYPWTRYQDVSASPISKSIGMWKCLGSLMAWFRFCPDGSNCSSVDSVKLSELTKEHPRSVRLSGIICSFVLLLNNFVIFSLLWAHLCIHFLMLYDLQIKLGNALLKKHFFLSNNEEGSMV